MPRSALAPPPTDPTPVFDLVRGNFATELLAAAVRHFGLFAKLAAGPLPPEELRRRLGLARRPFVVLTAAVRGMGLVGTDGDGRFTLTPLSEDFLVPGAAFDVTGYVGLTAELPGVLATVERLRADRPAKNVESDEGAAFIYREGVESAMDRGDSARRLTLALAGRAKVVAPSLAEGIGLGDSKLLVDVAGGTGIYAVACLQRYPGLRAVVLDRPEVLKVAREFAAEYGVADRMAFAAGDMFADPLPAGADAVLLSNVLHDWDEPRCRELVGRCAAALPAGGRLVVHDVYLDDDLGGPLPVALYSAALFTLTEGRAYSAAEYRGWLEAAGLAVGGVVPTAVHCGLLVGVKTSAGS